jgi:type VI secretion system secreted protein Hcp
MAFDAFITFEVAKGSPVKGEVTTKGFEGAIEVTSFEWSVSQNTTLSGHGPSAGKIKLNAFKIGKRPDSSTPKLFQYACAGQHFDNAVIHLRKSGGTQSLVYQKIEFETVFITNMEQVATEASDEVPTESISFVFGTIRITYTPQKADGTGGGAIIGGWNVKESKVH